METAIWTIASLGGAKWGKSTLLGKWLPPARINGLSPVQRRAPVMITPVVVGCRRRATCAPRVTWVTAGAPAWCASDKEDGALVVMNLRSKKELKWSL